MEEVINRDIARLESLELDADYTHQVRQAEERIGQKGRGELELLSFCGLQGVSPQFVPPNRKSSDKSPSVVIVTDNGHDNVLVLHIHDHALSKTEGEEENDGMKNDALDGEDKGNEVGTKS